MRTDRRRGGTAGGLALALVLGLGAAGAAGAQDGRTELTPDQLMTLAAETMAGGNAAGAAVLADALIRRDPQDVPALILRSEAAIAQGDYDSGLAAARRAWGAAEVEPARYAAARLAALAHSQQEHYTRSQFWLRRARQHAPDAESRESVAEDYAWLRRQNPLSFQLEFNIAPSDNINNGTDNRTLILPGLPFVFLLTGDSQPLSGTEYTLGGGLRYRLHETETTLTYAEVQGYGRTYTLSNEAKDLVPDAEGSDYAELQLAFGLGHFWLAPGSGDPWHFDIERGRFWYGGEPYLDFTRVGVNRAVTLSGTDRLRFGALWEDLDEVDGIDSEAVTLRTGWDHIFGQAGMLSLGLRTRRVEADGFDRAYDADAATVGWRFAETGMEVSFDYEERFYEESFYTFGTRVDVRRELRIEMPLPAVEVYGFSPVLNVERSTTDSNVTRFETKTTGAGITFRSAF